MAEIIITGASGFIGSELLKNLKKNKFNVKGYSRKKIKGINYIKDYNQIKANRNKILVHLAQNSKITNALMDEEIRNNISLSKKLSNKQWMHIIYISSSNIYKSSEKINNENSHISLKRNDYNKIKIESEKIFNKSKSTIFRLSNVYGKNMSNNSLFKEIISQIYKKNKIIVKDIRPIRDYIFINDVIDAIKISIKNKTPGIYNLSYGKSYSVKYIISLFKKISNNKKEVISQNLIGNSKIYISNKRVKKTFGWKPKNNIQKGIKLLLS